MTRYNTGYPVPSPAMPDVWDNNETIDSFVNSPENSVTTRTGIVRDTMFGMQKKADEQRIAASVALAEQMDSQESAFNAAQTDKEDRFQGFLNSSGYVFLGNYENGPFQFSARNQYIRYNNQYYRLNAATDVGFTTTGTDATSFASDVNHFVLMDGDTLRQNLGSSDGASLIGGLGFKTPEMRGAIGNGIANDTAAIRDVMSVEGATVLLSHDYLCEPNITPAANVKIIGNGKIICTTGEEWVWSASDRASPYPAFFIINPGVTIQGITIESTYEAVLASSGGDDLTLLFVKGGGTETSRAKSSAFVFFNVRNVRAFGIEGAYTGEVATWDAALSKIISGGCDGFDFGNVIDMYIFYSYFHDVGRNGINWYGASNVHIDHCTQRYCGQSGIQPGPHPNYSVAFISNNLAEYCCADSIDARYIGSDIVNIGLTMSDCESDWIGMLYGDVNYIGVDGTGTFTLARVKGVTATNFQARNFSGAAAWFDFASDVTASNIKGDSPYSRYGVGFFTPCDNIKLSNFDIKVKGPALWFGGNSSFTDFSIDGASKFESYEGYAVLMPNNPLTRFKISDTTFTGYKICNLIFEVDNVEFVHKGTDEPALYLGSANLFHGKLKCTGTTSAVLVNVGVGSGVYLSVLEAENQGSGDTLSLVASVNFSIGKARIWNTGSGGGAALRISGEQNNSTLDKLDLYSVSGRPLVSTATHTDLTLSLVRENGALASSWSDKSNVYRTSRALIS
ncbi:TPA: hypothetical protein OMI83_000985 [Klebsiella pneumoniae]|nr:hypothetical protein [Klebsiella pneumoniae]